MNIRPETQSDYAAIATLLPQTFSQVNEAQLVDRIRQSDRYIPSLSWVIGVRLLTHPPLMMRSSESSPCICPAGQSKVKEHGA